LSPTKMDTAEGLKCRHASHFFLATFMYLTPQALHRVLGPWGPARHTGVTCTQFQYFIVFSGARADSYDPRVNLRVI